MFGYKFDVQNFSHSFTEKHTCKNLTNPKIIAQHTKEKEKIDKSQMYLIIIFNVNLNIYMCFVMLQKIIHFERKNHA